MSNIKLSIQSELEQTLMTFISKLMTQNNLTAFEMENALNKVLIQIIRLEQNELVQELREEIEKLEPKPEEESVELEE